LALDGGENFVNIRTSRWIYIVRVNNTVEEIKT